MSLALTFVLAAVLFAVAAVHLSWAFGLDWPAPKGELALYVTPGTRRPSPPITVAVAIAIALAGVVILSLRTPLAAPWNMLAAAAYYVLMLVFLLRGMAGYFPRLWRAAEGRPFHRLNRIYYSPLCLVIAGGMAANTLVS